VPTGIVPNHNQHLFAFGSCHCQQADDEQPHLQTVGLSSAEIQQHFIRVLSHRAKTGQVFIGLTPFWLTLHQPEFLSGLKQGGLVLTFVSPQVGERHLDRIRDLSEQTGYTLSIHPHPNQQQILQIAGQLLREAGWRVLKGPGIHVDRAEVSVRLAEEPNAAALEDVRGRLLEQTGYTLVAEA
jgi:hypothetical protein